MSLNLAEKTQQMSDFFFQKGVALGREEGREEGERKGIILGSIATMRSLNYSKDAILEKLSELFSLTPEQAMPFIEAMQK